MHFMTSKGNMSLPSLSTQDYSWTFCSSPFPLSLSFSSKSNFTVAKRKISGRKDTKHDLNGASRMQGQPWFVSHSRFLKHGQSETGHRFKSPQMSGGVVAPADQQPIVFHKNILTGVEDRKRS